MSFDSTGKLYSHDELVHMYQNRRGEYLRTETPPFRGGTQELCDLEMIEYVKDSGLVTTYRLLPNGRDYLSAQGLLK